MAPLVHAGLEVVYPFIFRSYLANSQIHFLAFMQVAELVGVIGMGFLMVLVSSLAAESFLAWGAGARIPVRGWVAAVLFLASHTGPAECVPSPFSRTLGRGSGGLHCLSQLQPRRPRSSGG